MSGSHASYQARTFAFLDKLRDCENSDAIGRAIVEEMSAFGFECVTCWTLPAPGHDPEEGIMLNTRPAAYIEHYAAQNYSETDPVLLHLRKTIRSFSWDEVRSSGICDAERRIIDEAREFSLLTGFIVPVLTRSGPPALFAPCGEAPDMTPEARNAVEIMGTMALQMLQRVLIEEMREATDYKPLTRREREVMQWVAYGKSDDEIGDILHISATTVMRHVENAKKKLDTYKRTAAVVTALRRGEIAL